MAPLFDLSPAASLDPRQIDAGATVFHLGDLLMAEAWSSGSGVWQGTGGAERATRDLLMIQLQTAGQGTAVSGSLDRRIQPGTFTLVDLAEPYLSVDEGFRCLALIVPRVNLAARLTAPIPPGGLMLSADHALGHILAAHLRASWETLPTLAPDVMPVVAEGLLAAVTNAVTPVGLGEPGLGTAIPRTAALLDHIDRHLHEPLNVDRLCLHFGYSRSVLYRMFAPYGGVGAYRQRRRLAGSYRELRSPFTPNRSTTTPRMRPVTAAIVLIVCTNLAAAPGAPQIDWMVTEFALVAVDAGAVAYTDLVDIRDQVEIPVSWSRWSGESATRVEYRLDDAPVLSESLAAGTSQSGAATLVVDQGGRYRLSVALCDAEDCTESASVETTVADTDGSHLPPLELTAGEHNRAYENRSGRVVASTFVEWGVYARQFPVDRIPAYNLTHLFYGFIPICGGDGINDALKQMSAQSYAGLQRACAGTPDFEVAIADPWAALQKPQQGHGWSTTYKGNFGQLMALKNTYPELKIVPSVGGWSLSDPFHFMADSLIRQRFVASVERFLRTWKFFDGIDIDWEYPGGQGANPALGDASTDGDTYVVLLGELRAMLDRIAAETGRELILTSAVSADPRKIGLIDYRAASEPLDRMLAMTYDFHGAWSLSDLGHHTALYAPD